MYNFEYLLPFVDPTILAYRGKSYNWSDLRLAVADGVYYYSFVAPADKHIVIYNRALDCKEGEVRLDLIAAPTSFTPGVSSPSSNLLVGGIPSGMTITRGVTGIVGGITTPPNSPVAYLGNGGNNRPVSAAAGQPTIIKPNTTILLKVTSATSGGTNGWINFIVAYSELFIPPSVYEDI